MVEPFGSSALSPLSTAIRRSLYFHRICAVFADQSSFAVPRALGGGVSGHEDAERNAVVMAESGLRRAPRR